jgi:hypothetical protein
MHNFFGLVAIIVKFPYEDNEDVFAWDSGGNQLEIVFEDSDVKTKST